MEKIAVMTPPGTQPKRMRYTHSWSSKSSRAFTHLDRMESSDSGWLPFARAWPASRRRSPRIERCGSTRRSTIFRWRQPIASGQPTRVKLAPVFSDGSGNCASQWHDVHFRSVAIDGPDGNYVYKVQVHLGKIDPEDVQIEIYADLPNSVQPFRAAMTLDHFLPDAPLVYQYSGAVPSDRPFSDYTPRAIPRRHGLLVPLETSLIAWQK